MSPSAPILYPILPILSYPTPWPPASPSCSLSSLPLTIVSHHCLSTSSLDCLSPLSGWCCPEIATTNSARSIHKNDSEGPKLILKVQRRTFSVLTAQVDILVRHQPDCLSPLPLFTASLHCLSPLSLSSLYLSTASLTTVSLHCWTFEPWHSWMRAVFLNHICLT